LPDHALATSGDFVQGPHIRDGRTGAAAGGALSGVAVIATNCMEADAWATALFALGAGEGLAMADAQGLAAVFAMRTKEGAVTQLSTPARAMLE
jgi:thiamine biosynthesis lipoprotein